MLPMTSVRAPADDRLPCTNLVTSMRRPDVFRASQPGPTSVLQPGDFLALGDFLSRAHTDVCETMQRNHEMPRLRASDCQKRRRPNISARQKKATSIKGARRPGRPVRCLDCLRTSENDDENGEGKTMCGETVRTLHSDDAIITTKMCRQSVYY